MYRTSVVIIGAGQAGLAVSRLLAAASVDHVLLERGRVAESWRSQRWDSLRLLTPNWMTRLPQWSYRGTQPTGFMSAESVVTLLDSYADSFGAPVVTGTEVRSVRSCSEGFLVETDTATWRAEAVVVATGHAAEPKVPGYAAELDSSVRQITPDRYRNPADVPDGRVLVVGASATGVQLADELRAAGRDVVLAAGRHTRMPRRYRGLDIMWWLDSMHLLAQPADLSYGARPPERSLQLIGDESGRNVDLASLATRGIDIVGTVEGYADGALMLRDDLVENRAAADAKLHRLLQRIDQFAVRAGLETELEPAHHPAATPPAVKPSPRRLVVGSHAVYTVIWATGYRRRYDWLQLPVLDAAGEIRHIAGRTPVTGLAVVGMAWQTRRNSSFIDGVGHDARLVVDHLLNDVLGSSQALREAS
ncbi:NAD(P)-binding domain-containing protein [Jatrophihabitans sp. DSM 45814]